MKAEIIAVGSELLTPDRVDTNSLFLTAELNKLGIEVVHKSVVGDSASALREAFAQAFDRADIVISSGGLGPTEDDLTRESVAELLGRKLESNLEVLRAIQERFARMGRQMAEVNKRQAMVPEGAIPLENPRGTAPGLWIEARDRVAILLPGPPDELQAMFARQVAERLARRGGTVRQLTRELRTTGMAESDLDERIKPIYLPLEDITTTILAGGGEIQIHLRTWNDDARVANQALDEIAQRMSMVLGDHIFSNNGRALEEVVAEALNTHNATISTAESCTGGLVAERLTRIPGSSSYFLGGVVSYSNELKTAWADVPPELIESRGAVSAEVAIALAEGVRRSTGSVLGIGITGVAGPSGGTPEKPVGLVHIALADGKETHERPLRFTGDRNRIRWSASQSALDMVRRYFLNSDRAQKLAKN
jgi:nicotinamide-nucleotide amidase